MPTYDAYSQYPEYENRAGVEVPDAPVCDACGSRDVSLLGALGRTVWGRCRDCGSDIALS